MRIPFLELAAGAGLAIGLVACGGGDQAARKTANPNAQPTAAQSSPGTMAATATGRGTQVRLIPLHDSGVEGSITLTPKGDSMVVAVDVTGLPDGAGSYPSHIHEGTCSSPGAVAQPLNDVQGDAEGNGHATTTVAMSVFKQGTSHLVMVHRKDGTMASCATMPANIGASGT